MPCEYGAVTYFLIDYGTSHNLTAITEPFTWINCIFRPEYNYDIFPGKSNAADLLKYIIGSIFPNTPQTINLDTNFGGNEELVFIFEDMLREYNEYRDCCEKILEHYLSFLLIKLARLIYFENKEKHPKRDNMVADALRRLEKSIDKNICAKEIAMEYLVSPSVFSEEFKLKVGISFREYVTRMRINEACELLITTNLNVGEIQNSIGYCDAKAFFKAFRKFTGTTPKEYRAYHRSDKQ